MRIQDIKPEDYAHLAGLLSLTRGRIFSVEQLQAARRGLKIWHTQVAVQDDEGIVGTYALSQSESDGDARKLQVPLGGQQPLQTARWHSGVYTRKIERLETRG